MFKSIMIGLISFQLQAGVTAQMNYDFHDAMGGAVAPKPGDTYDWANGTLTRNSDGSLTYVNKGNPNDTAIIKNDSDLKSLAQNSPDVRKTWVEQYGVDALGTDKSYADSKASLNSLFAKQGKPNSSVPIDGMNAMVYYDSNGMAKTVIAADGTSMSVQDFMNTKSFEAKIGSNDSGNSDEIDPATAPSGSGNSVPANFNGEVMVTTNKDSSGNFDILAGLSAATGGPFDRPYNGVSGSVPSDPPLSDLEYNEKYLILAAQIWGITEIGEKMCKPLGKAFPKSLSSWWLIIKNYVEAEKKRDALVKVRAAAIKDLANTLTTKAGGNSTIQLDGMKLQIESLNVSIDSLAGSSLYSGDNKASDARATSRIAWREALLVATFQGIEDAKTEDSKVIQAYNACNIGIDQSLKVATKACAKTKKNDCAVNQVKECNGANTGSVDVSDAPPGACEMKNRNIPLLQKVAMKDLATLYGVSPIPSKEMNERLMRITSFIGKEINVFFPKSTDSNFDWSTPLKACTDPLVTKLKNNGVICPANASEKDYDKTKFQNLGKSDDPFTEMNHYTCGESNAPSASSYANTAKFYNDSLTAISADPKNSTKSKEDLQNMALQADWNNWTNSPYSQNYVAGKSIDAGVDKTAERKFADDINKQYNITDNSCNNAAICNPKPELVKSSSVAVASPKEVTQSARLFLGAMGISQSSIEDSAKLLSGYWDIDDLYMGQSNIRQTYFQYNQKLITDLVLADRNKLAQMLIDRQKLIDAYNNLKKIMDANSGKSGGSGASGVGALAAGSGAAAAGSVNGNLTAASDPMKALSAAGPVSFSNSAGSLDATSMLGLEKGSAGRLTFSNTSTGSSLSGSGKGQMFSVAQGKKMNQSNNNIKKLSHDISNLLNSSKNMKGTDENKSNSNFNKLSNNNMKPNYMSGAGLALIGALGGGNSVKEADLKAAEQAKSNSQSKDNLYSSDASAGVSAASGNSNSNSANGSNDNSNDDRITNSKAQGLMGKGFNYTNLSDDDKRLMEAIYARDKENKNKYDKKESDSLFDQITKAHIRTYDRVKK